MALGIEDCVKLTRQASTDNERMAILLLIGMDFQTLDEKRIHGHKLWSQPTIRPDSMSGTGVDQGENGLLT